MIKLLTIAIATGVTLWISIILLHSYAQSKALEDANDYNKMLQRCISHSRNVRKNLWNIKSKSDLDRIEFEIQKECKRLGGMR